MYIHIYIYYTCTYHDSVSISNCCSWHIDLPNSVRHGRSAAAKAVHLWRVFLPLRVAEGNKHIGLLKQRVPQGPGYSRYPLAWWFGTWGTHQICISHIYWQISSNHPIIMMYICCILLLIQFWKVGSP